MAKDLRLEFQWSGSQYPSLYKGKRLSDPQHKIWVNFPWEEMKPFEKNYIKNLWNRHTSKNYWPINQMKLRDDRVISDTAKFRFFDLINLAPTSGEFAGYQKKTLDDNTDFFVSYKSNIQYKRKNGTTGQIYNGFVELPSINSDAFKAFEGEKQKLKSVRFNGSQLVNEDYNGHGIYYDSIIKNRSIPADLMYHPSEDEYKLSWMRDLVTLGVEARMGPFAWISDNSTPPKGLQTYKDGPYMFRIGDLRHLLDSGYSKSRYEADGTELNKYHFRLLYNWAQNEFDWARNEYIDQYGINHNYPTYNKNPFPKAPVSSLEELLNGGFQLTSADQLSLTSPSKRGHGLGGLVIRNGITLDIQNVPDNEIQLITITRGNSGLPVFQTSNGSNHNDVIEIEERQSGIGAPKTLKLITGIGIPPHFANDADAKNYIVSGWITIPKIFGNVKLPWPFVWKYFGLKGFRKFGPNGIGPDLTETFFKEKWAAEQGYENYYPKQTTGDDFWRYNYRLRLWWYKYSSTNLPERELLFYLRMKYGISHAVGYRYVTWTPPTLTNILEVIAYTIYKAGIFLGSVYKLGGNPTNINDADSDNIFNFYKKIDTSLFTGGLEQFNFHRQRFNDAIMSGGLPNGSEKFDGTSIDEYYTSIAKPSGLFNIPQALQKDENGIQYHVRSMYISQFQDRVGWLRSTENRDYQIPDERFKYELKGNEQEVVKYDKNGAISGYYTFNGHGTDRLPIFEDQGYASYKFSVKSDIKINDVSLYKLFERKEDSGDRISDDNDRYTSPEQLQSYDWTCIDGKCKEIAEKDKVYYHNHRLNPGFSVKDEFNPALLSPIELQFMYEAVSFILYGDTPVTNPRLNLTSGKNESFIWSKTNTNTYSDLHRWDELTKKINIPLGQLGDKWYIPSVDGINYELNIRGDWSVTLADYILWAAPTSDQYYKKKFSEINDTFLSKLRGIIQIGEGRDTKPHNFPFDALASYILESEKPKNLRPLVPAFVHHRYISRKMNDDRLVYPNGGDARGVEGINIENITIQGSDSDKIQQNILRTLGGVYDDNDEGVLITLPTFVLGGRPKEDLGREDSDTWDYSWGSKPWKWSQKDKKLLVGNLDAVIDAWAAGKLHNGKQVSAMEIMFWIRYKHGLAAAPTSRRVIHEIPTTTGIHRGSVSNAWPKFLTNLVVDNNSAELGNPRRTNGDGKFLLPHETLNNVEMVVSYYSPILVNQYDFLCHDPLIELDTTPPSGYEDAEYAAYTGFNSYYGCYWPGTKKVTGIRKSKTITLNDYDGNFRISMTYPSTTSMKTNHTNHYLLIHSEYRKAEKNIITSGKSKGISITGFDYHGTERECKKVILCSDIQSWFKAYRILAETDKFAEYIDRGINHLPPGHPDSVLEVEAEIKDEGEKGKVHLYISGAGIGSKLNTFRAKRVLSFSERMRQRPWFERLESGIGNEQIEAVNLCDDYSLGTVGCIPQYAYMRHVLNPNVFMWSSNNEEVSQGGFYTYNQVDLIKAAIHKTSIFWSKEGYGIGTYFGTPDPETSTPETNKALEYGERISGLALQSLALSLTSEKWALDTNYQKDPAKKSRVTQLVNHFAFVQNQKTTWNTNAKIGSVIAAAVSGVTIFDLKYAKTDDIKQVLIRANDFLSKRYKTLYMFSVLGKSTKWFSSNIFDHAKSMLDFIGAGYFGWEKPPGLPEPEYYGTLSSGTYKKLKPWIAIGKREIFAWLQTYLLKATVGRMLTTATATAGRLGTIAATRTIVSTAGGTVIGTALAITGVGLAITVVVSVVAYTVDRFQEQWENNNFYQAIWNLRNEASKNGYLEGPYIESEGKLLIKKTKTGKIPILGYNYGNDTDETNLEYSGMYDGTFVNYVIEQNKDFYRSGGGLDKILADIPSDSCECRFFESIFKDQSNISIKNIENWNSGPYRRRLKDRFNVIDEAPNHSDISIVLKRAPRPSATTTGLNAVTRFIPNRIKELAEQKLGIRLDPESQQISREQVGPYMAKNVRPIGNNGTTAVLVRDCPRFWWPTTLIQSSTDLCEFIAENGKYPKRSPEFFKICDPISNSEFVEKYLVFERLGRVSKNLSEFNTYSLSPLIGQYNFSRYNVSGDYIDIKYYEYNHQDIPISGIRADSLSRGFGVSETITYSTKNLYSKRETNTRHSRNDYPLYGESVITSEGVLGPAPPHEREIINIFRKKYKIDIVMPVFWRRYDQTNSTNFNTIDKNSDYIYNPYKDNRQPKSNEWGTVLSSCCSLGEVLNEDASSDATNSLSFKQTRASYCEYLITLNTPQFREKILNHCRGKKDNEDRTTKTQQAFSEVLPVPNSPDPRPEPPDEEYPESKTPDCQSCDDDRRNDEPIINTPNPRLPNCTNCDTNRPFLVELKKILPEVLRTPSRLREAFNQGSNTAFFNGIVFEWDYYETPTGPLSNPLLPRDAKVRSGWRLTSFSSFTSVRSQILGTQTTRYQTRMVSSRRPDLNGDEWSS